MKQMLRKALLDWSQPELFRRVVEKKASLKIEILDNKDFRTKLPEKFFTDMYVPLLS